MSAPESAVVATPVVAEEVKATETTPVVVDTKTEEPAAVADVVPTTVEAEVPAEESTATEEPAKPESKDGESKDSPPKSPKRFLTNLTKLLSPFKSEKKAKVPKSPKKEKKTEEVEAAATAETPKETPAEVAAEVPAEVPVETVKEVEAAVAEPATAEVPEVVAEEVKETPATKAEAKAVKIGRRLSARVGDLFRSKPKTEVNTPAKVDELPPKIDKPVAMAPLENPATEGPKVEETAKPVEVAAPVVAAAA